LSGQGLTEKPKSDLAFCLALLKETDPDLAAVVQAWPSLSKHVKAEIVRLAKTTTDKCS
jgi:hypothetical protein